jgi:hypothetical protein
MPRATRRSNGTLEPRCHAAGDATSFERTLESRGRVAVDGTFERRGRAASDGTFEPRRHTERANRDVRGRAGQSGAANQVARAALMIETSHR